MATSNSSTRPSERARLAARPVMAALVVLALAGCETMGGVGDTVGKWGSDTADFVSSPFNSDNKAESPKRYMAIGTASWYGKRFHNKKTASGERYNMNKMTAAHPTLEFGTRVRVTNLSNRRSVVVRINDRGPKSKKNIIDVSRKAAGKLGFRRKGKARVRVEQLSTPKKG